MTSVLLLHLLIMFKLRETGDIPPYFVGNYWRGASLN
jgi:hypothetical protein